MYPIQEQGAILPKLPRQPKVRAGPGLTRRLSRGSAAVKKAVPPSFAVPPGFAVLASIYEVASRQAACCCGGGKTLEIEVIVLIFIDNLLALIGQLESAFPYK